MASLYTYDHWLTTDRDEDCPLPGVTSPVFEAIELREGEQARARAALEAATLRPGEADRDIDF